MELKLVASWASRLADKLDNLKVAELVALMVAKVSKLVGKKAESLVEK